MGICWSDIDMDAIDKKLINTKSTIPKQIIIKYTKLEPSTLEEHTTNKQIEYIINGLKQDLFPANYKRNGDRWTWGVAISIPSDITLNPDVFTFDKTLCEDIKNTINYSKSLKGDYGDSGPHK